MFNYILFSHVYKEINATVDNISKEGVQLEAGVWLVMESKDGQVVEVKNKFIILTILLEMSLK